MWRKLEDQEEIVELLPSDCLTIPVGTYFQFRSLGRDPFVAVGVTMPPWPGEGEAIECKGPWQPTVPAGPGLGAKEAPLPGGGK